MTYTGDTNSYVRFVYLCDKIQPGPGWIRIGPEYKSDFYALRYGKDIGDINVVITFDPVIGVWWSQQNFLVPLKHNRARSRLWPETLLWTITCQTTLLLYRVIFASITSATCACLRKKKHEEGLKNTEIIILTEVGCAFILFGAL